MKIKILKYTESTLSKLVEFFYFLSEYCLELRKKVKYYRWYIESISKFSPIFKIKKGVRK
jgi:hypothetical protein